MIGEGNQLQVEGDLRELPDNHWNRVYTDQGYFDGFAKRPSIQTGASLSPFPETYAKRQANIAYMSSSLGIPIDEMPSVYDAKKNELAKQQMGMPTLSDEGLFNYYKKQFDRENEVNSAANGIYQEVQKSVFESLFKGETANDINNQPTYRPLLEQKLNEAGDLLSDQERLNIREQADKMADNLRRANTSVTDDARWLFDLVSKQTGRGKEYEQAGEQPNPTATVGGLGPVMNLAVKQPAPAPEGEMDLNDPEMLNFQTEQVLEKFADMPTEQRKSIYLLAGAFAELNQVDKGVFYQAAETLGRFLTREMGERISRNVTEEMIRGQQRLLDSDIPLYEANNLDGSKGLSQVPTSGQTPLNAEQRAKLKESGTRKLKLLQVKRELVNLADTKIDPIKVVTNWPTWEQGLYGFAGSIPYAAVAAIPFVGFPAITASFFGQYKDDLLLEYPDMDPDQAATISALAAPMAAGLELIQANLLMGKFVALDRVIKFFLKPSRNPMTRIIARGTASFTAETGVELAQNRVQPLVQTIGAALDEDIPGYNWEKLAEGFDEELGVTAVTMLLFTLTGLPFITSQEINRNADYLKDKKILKYFGASEDQAERVATSLTKEERVENWKDVTANLDPKLVEAGRRQMFRDTMAQLAQPEDPYMPVMRRDGERYTVLDSDGNVVADRVDADTAFYEYNRIAGSDEVLFASVQGELINTLLEAGKATNPEGFTERIEVATQEVVNRYNNMTPEQLQRRIAQWERETGQTWQPGAAVNITAVNTLEQVKEGLFQSITRVVKAKSPEEIRAVLEDRAEGQYKIALQAGQFTEADMVGWIREYEAGTGDSLLEEDFTSRDVVEAVSTMSVAYYSGNLDNSRVSSRLRAFFEALKEYFTAIFARGVRIKEAIAAGQIAPEFEAFLAQSVGLDLDRQIEVQASQEARANVLGEGLVEDTFSIAGPRAQLPSFMMNSYITARGMAAEGKSSEEIRAITGWFPHPFSPDGRLAFEIPDNEARFTLRKDASRINGLDGKTLGQILDHPALFAAYPDLKNIEVYVMNRNRASGWRSSMNGANGKFFRPYTNTYNGQLMPARIWLSSDLSKKSALNTLLHEIQHAIQAREGFPRGSNVGEFLSDGYTQQEAFDAYRRTAGEIEARDVASRQTLTPEQRAATAPYSSSNIAPEDALIMTYGSVLDQFPESTFAIGAVNEPTEFSFNAITLPDGRVRFAAYHGSEQPLTTITDKPIYVSSMPDGAGYGTPRRLIVEGRFLLEDQVETFAANNGIAMEDLFHEEAGMEQDLQLALKEAGYDGAMYYDQRRDNGDVIPAAIVVNPTALSFDGESTFAINPKRNSLRVRMTRQALTDAALSQASWRDWYDEHKEVLDEFFGDFAPLFQELLAVTSQASSVKSNVSLALKAFGQLMRGEDFDDRTRGKEKPGYLDAVIGNLNAIRDRTQVGGKKIKNYKAANEGDTMAVVVDRHIASLLFGVKSPTAAQFAKAEQILTEIAAQIGWTPRQVQAALWAHSIVKSGKTPESYGAYLKKLEERGVVLERIGNLGDRSRGGDGLGGGRGRFAPAGQEAGDSRTFSINPYPDREQDPGAPLTETEIREEIEGEPGLTADIEVDPAAWETLDDKQGRTFSIRPGAPTEGNIPQLLYKQLKGKNAFFYFADRMRVGEYTGLDPASGIKIALQGGPGYPFTLGNDDADAGWAFTDDGSVFTTFANRVKGTDGIGIVCLFTEGNIRGNKAFLKAYMAEVAWAVKSGKLTKDEWLAEANRIRQATLGKAKRDGTTIGEGKAAWIPLWKKEWTTLKQAEKALEQSTYDIRGGSFFGFEPTKVGQKGSIIGATKLVEKGFPNIDEMIKAMEDPRFAGLQYGDMVAAVQFDKGDTKPYRAGDLNVKQHDSYDVIIKGKALGMFDKPKSVLTVIKTDKPRAAALRALSMSMASTTFAISPANYYGDLQAAVAALDSNPAFRRERVAAVLSKFKRIKEQFANKDGLEPLSMPEAVAQLEAIITLLPPDAQSEVGGFRRLLSFATAKGRLNYLTDRIAKADAALEKYLRTELQLDIMDLLERAEPRRGENKVQTSSLGPDAQRVANLAIAAIELGTDETSNTMAEIEAALASPDITPDRQEQLLEQWGVLNALGDFFNRSALELDQARVFLRQTFGAGRAMWRMQQEARRKQYRDMAEELAGGLKKATENQIDKMDKENPWLKNPRQFVLSHYSFMQLLRSVLPKASFLETWERSIRQAEIGSSRYRMDAAKRFIDTLMAASGKKTSFGVGRLMYDMRKTRKAAVRYKEGYNEKLIRLPMETAANILEGRASAKAFKLNAEAVAKMSEAYLAVPLMRRRTTPSGAVRETPNRQQFLEFYVLQSEGTDDKLNMSPAEAMQLLLAWDQSEVQARMRRQGWTDESVEDMQKMVTSVPGGEATMDFLRREYKAGGDAADPVYMRMFGMAMPRIENYAPTRYRHKDDSNDLSPMGSALELAGTTPGSLKARQRHDARMRRTDAITVFFQHAAQMGHWIHFAEINREIRGVLKNQNVRESMEATLGRSGLQIFDQWMDTLAQGGGRRAMELSADKDIWAALISGKSIASLGFSVRTLFMQIDAASRAALDMGLAEYTKTVLDPRWMADMPKAWNSDTVQRRLIEGSRPEVRYVFERAAVRPSMLLWAAQKSMIPMQMTDAALTSFTAAIVYRNAYNKAKKAEASDAMAEQAALDAMDKAVFNYSQPIDITSRSLREVQGNMLQKVYMMFLSDARLKTALFAEAIGQLGKEGERGKGASTISALMIMAVVTQTMANLYRDWFSDEPDDEIWTLEGYAMAMMLAPLSGYMLVGTVGSTVVREAFGEMTFQSTDPANEMIDRGIRSIKGWDNTFNTEDPEAMLKQWNNLLRFASFNPTLAAPAALLNFAKPIVGAMENAENPE
jgi:hypothetical protein